MKEQLTYALIAPHANASPSWYLKLSAGDHKLAMSFHRWLSVRLQIRYGNDPHYEAALKKECPIAILKHPIVLGAKWLMSVNGFFVRGLDVFVNSSGGILVNPVVHREVLSEKWPDATSDGEIVSVNSFTPGKHFYLTSNKRILPTDKLNSKAEVEEFIKSHCPSARVVWKEPKRIERDGD